MTDDTRCLGCWHLLRAAAVRTGDPTWWEALATYHRTGDPGPLDALYQDDPGVIRQAKAAVVWLGLAQEGGHV